MTQSTLHRKIQSPRSLWLLLGAARLSASGLHELVQLTKEQLRETISQRETGGKNYLFEQLSGETKRLIEEICKGKEEETT